MTFHQQITGSSFANEWYAAREQRAAEVWLDPGTHRHLQACEGEGECLQMTAGGVSIAQWLCHQGGKKGHALTTDIDPRFLREHVWL